MEELEKAQEYFFAESTKFRNIPKEKDWYRKYMEIAYECISSYIELSERINYEE